MFCADATYGEASREALRRCLAEGQVVACEVVWAEVATGFPRAAEAVEALERLEIDFSPIGMESAISAGGAFRAFRAAGGQRQRVVADFLVAAHAEVAADRLLSRDRGFFRRFFDGLEILNPSRG